ncbi:MAG: NAD-glutamate dehydrogenase [Geminicoccaceae bacterium]|nr:NAD-glutamate dehydrogenase [Geminicoccaceae bacterium]
MQAHVKERKDEIVDHLGETIRERLGPEEAPLAERFARLYYGSVAAADIEGCDPLDLYGEALAHLRFGARRRPGEALIRVYNPKLGQHGWQSTHTIVEIVNDDMPFLVDSVGMALARHGLGTHLVIHPVMAVRRDAEGRLLDVGPASDDGAPHESFMHVEIDRQSDGETLAAVEADIAKSLVDVRNAVQDWREMRAKVGEVLDGLAHAKGAVDPAELEESEAFLRWLADDNFTFLGFSSYDLERGEGGLSLRRIKGSGLGLLRAYDEGLPSRSFAAMTPAARARAEEPSPPLAITKANARSTVHRSAYLDFIGVKRYGADGKVVGEHRFLGLFTSTAYSLSIRNVPLLRRKVEQVVQASGFTRSGHNGKALAHLLETYPRDELFQIGEGELLRTAMEILHLQERQQIRLILRRDPFERFVSCLVYIPRERYNTTVRQRFQEILEDALGSKESDFQAQLAESTLARILFIVRTPDGIRDGLDAEAIERRLREAATSWTDRLRQALDDAEGEEEGNRLFARFGQAFPAGYQERQPARAAVPDILDMDALGNDADRLAMSLYRRLEDGPELVRFRLIRPNQPVHLSDALPILEDMGLRVLAEVPSRIEAKGGDTFWLHDFAMTAETGEVIDVDALKEKFQNTFSRIWSGGAENDGFNRLVLAGGLDVSDVVVLRAYCKYALQVGTTFSQAYIERTLVANPAIARDLAALFRLRFDPALQEDRAVACEAQEKRIEAGLDGVASLDEDRILRLYLELIRATLRTNAFQTDPATGGGKDYLSCKFDPAKVPGMPLPRPLFEIFVYAPYVEGVHLRGGRVARGGLRWSDRREDFRTEVLGLVKAQMVKNSVIVPVGAKGGFYVKRPPQGGDRAAQVEEAIRCYKTFLCGLLDITDNRKEGGVVPPPDVMRYDDDDPYLVVAADKGTATFSDIANGVSRSYGFWLDDAFASGGSAGYDHKGMGITAKGAWESVKRHFRELGMDPQVDPFTCVGIGDMSGDVFGNGMLLSEEIKLVAAFDHRHVFMDPDPDPAASFEERQRLFALPRSSWADYDKAKISEGGGVYPRTLKSIPVSPEMRRVLGIEAEALPPADLINAILKAPVDLWWNGGIGTYVKASFESHADAADRSNDVLRIDGRDIGAKVVGEGGNLGCTQRARIEYALKGGRINTDFIDNSAGVDCSDHEVNIKILLGEAVAAGDLTMKQRDRLLASMTDEVAGLVLRDNVLQNIALSMSEALGTALTDAHLRFMRKLEARGRLNRLVELLPSDDALAERQAAGRGLTRPEIAVLLAYAKMTVFADLLETELPDRPFFLEDLADYFPTPLRERFADGIAAHRLRREIVATIVANDMVNKGLEVFVSEIEDETGAHLADIALAYIVARDSLALPAVYDAVEALGREVPAERQTAMLNEARATLVGGTRWFLAHVQGPLSIRETVDRFAPQVRLLMAGLEGLVAPVHAEELQGRVAGLKADGVPDDTAVAVARLPYARAACDLVAVAGGGGEDRLRAAARVYFALDAVLRLGWLHGRLGGAALRSRWDRLVLTNLEDELAGVLQRLTLQALETEPALGRANGGTEPQAAVERWLEANVRGLDRHRGLIGEIEGVERPDLAMLSVAVGVASRLVPKVAA